MTGAQPPELHGSVRRLGLVEVGTENRRVSGSSPDGGAWTLGHSAASLDPRTTYSPRIRPMGRPALAVGTHGKTGFVSLPDGRVQARVRFRDYDGRTRPVTKIGATKAAAERALKGELAHRRRLAGVGGITSDMRLTDLADLWLTQVDESDRAVQTKQQYRKVVDHDLRKALGQLRLSECSVGACDRALSAIKRRSPSVAKSARAALSGMLGLAATHDAISVNPVRDTTAISRKTKSKPRALTPDEADDLCDKLRAHERALMLDLPDLVEFCLATGARIGEALACRATALDLEAGTWDVNATIIRVKAAGLIIQPVTKTAAGMRTLALPPFAVAMLRRRQAEKRLRGPQGVVFASPTRRSVRDPSNCAGDLRDLRDELGYPWVTFKSLRKTVATRMDEAKYTPREIAEQLGHSKPSMTMDVYQGRGTVNPSVAALLDR